jgi:hypothetical protein
MVLTSIKQEEKCPSALSSSLTKAAKILEKHIMSFLLLVFFHDFYQNTVQISESIEENHRKMLC